MTKKTTVSTMSAYLKAREISDFRYLVEQIEAVLSEAQFLVVTKEGELDSPLYTNFLIEREGVATELSLELSRSNVITRNNLGLLTGKFKFTPPNVVYQVIGALFGQWMQEVAERAELAALETEPE